MELKVENHREQKRWKRGRRGQSEGVKNPKHEGIKEGRGEMEKEKGISFKEKQETKKREGREEKRDGVKR